MYVIIRAVLLHISHIHPTHITTPRNYPQRLGNGSHCWASVTEYTDAEKMNCLYSQHRATRRRKLPSTRALGLQRTTPGRRPAPAPAPVKPRPRPAASRTRGRPRTATTRCATPSQPLLAPDPNFYTELI